MPAISIQQKKNGHKNFEILLKNMLSHTQIMNLILSVHKRSFENLLLCIFFSPTTKTEHCVPKHRWSTFTKSKYKFVKYSH